MRRIGYMHIPLKTASDFGSLIRSRRKARGLGQAELAEMVGVSRRWLNQVEAGKPGASLSLVMNTLNALNIQIEVRANEDRPSPEGIAPVLGPDIDDILGDYDGTQ
jgi:y4mF family transcriptional regulator